MYDMYVSYIIIMTGFAVQFLSASSVSAFPTIKMKHWKPQPKKFDRRLLDATKGSSGLLKAIVFFSNPSIFEISSPTRFPWIGGQ